MIDRKNGSTFLENTQKHKTPGQTIEAEISFIIISYATSKKILQSTRFLRITPTNNAFVRRCAIASD